MQYLRVKAIDAAATIRPPYYVHRISPAGFEYYKVAEYDTPHLNDELRKFYIRVRVLAGAAPKARAHVDVISKLLLTLNVTIDKMAAEKWGFWKRRSVSG